MPIAPIFQELSPITPDLGSIYLDPNNPRFTDSKWSYIADGDIDKSDVQEVAQRRLVQGFDVDKLRMNMEVNGYLPIDRVVVREFAPGKYVVLEGNRRICAAKMISEVAIDGSSVHDDVRTSIREIPCLLYTGTESNASWIFQGLRHISGVVEWSAFNKAKLLVEQMEAESLSLTEVGKRFGLTPHGAGQWVRGYRAYGQAREESDYLHEVDERSYPYFQELFSRSCAPLRQWLGWKDEDGKFGNLLDFNEFVGWIYPRADGGEEPTSSMGKGDFDKRRIARRDDLRTVVFLMTKAPDCFSQFRAGTDLEKAYSLALAKDLEEEARKNSDPVTDVFTAIQRCTKALGDLPYRAMRDEATKARIFAALDGLENTIGDLRRA